MSEVSEGPSEPGSPVKAGMNGKIEVSIEEAQSSPLRSVVHRSNTIPSTVVDIDNAS